MITDPVFYYVAIPAVLVTGIAKGGFGGVGLLAVPLLSLVISPVLAAAIMLPILLVMDVFGLRAYWKTWDRRNLTILLCGAVIGLAIGAFTARWVSDDLIRLIIGAICVLFTCHWLLRGRTASAVKNPNAPIGVFLGTISGFTSFVAHAGAPAFQLFMLPQKLDRRIYAGTSAFYFAVVNVLKVIPYGMLGMLGAGNLSTSLVLVPLAPVGVFFGVWLNKRLSNEQFYKVMYCAIFLVGAKLIWDGLGI